MSDIKPALYGVSVGNGNDGVSHLYPNFVVRTSDPYSLAAYVLVDGFKPRFIRQVMQDMTVDGEAEFTISATLYDPPGRDGAGWSDANGAFRIVEVFPITEEEAEDAAADRERGNAMAPLHFKTGSLVVHDGNGAAVDEGTRRILRRMGKPVEMPDPVMVRVWKGEESNPLVMFLTEGEGLGRCSSWQPVGEHGPCDMAVVRDTRPATEEEARDVLARYVASYPKGSHPVAGYRVVQRDHPSYATIRNA